MNTTPRIILSSSPLKNIFERCIHFIYKKCIAPRAGTEDSQRNEFILNFILCIIIALLVVLDGFILISTIHLGMHKGGISFVNFTIVIFCFGYLLLLSRSGYYKIASGISLLIYFAATTYGALNWGVELPLVAISYIVIIVISSILISTRFAFIMSTLISVIIIAITKMQINGAVHPELSWKYAPVSIHDPIQLSIVFFVISGVSWLSNKEMERSLQRARRSEKALLEERNLLEIKVEERTKELKNVQKDKLTQLYRFAEFGKNASGIFHDLMNSLHIVVGSTNRLEYSTEHLPEITLHVAKAVTASKRLGGQISLARKQFITNETSGIFQLGKEITDVLDVVQFRIREANVHIETVIDNSITLHGNAIKLYQVVLNLVSNAIEACEEHKNDTTICITLEYTDNKNTILLTVSDTGCGIDPHLIESIFNPFFTTKSIMGIGLGLSHTKDIIEQEFHGTIIVKSEKNKGTTFIVTFPCISQSTINDIATTDTIYSENSLEDNSLPAAS